MASGDTLGFFTPYCNEPTTSNFATLDLRNSHPCLDFDASTNESAVFTGFLPSGYAGGGLTITIIWAATSATTGNVVWLASIERLEDEGTDTDADSFAATQTVTSAAPGTSGALQYSNITFTNGTQIDSLVVNEMYRIKITRDAANVSDTMTGDAELFGVRIRET